MAVVEVLKKLIPFLESRLDREDPEDVLPTLRRVEHDVDRIKQQLDVMVRDQGDLTAAIHRIERRQSM
jgi:uncharacterized protein Yka (UPF0111/DUF47 family)